MKCTRSLCRKLVMTNRTPFVVTIVIFGILAILPGSPGMNARRNRGIDMCEPIDIPMCKSMKYNMTRMPNHLHHSTIENARLAIQPYGELLKQNCSEDLLFFLCAMFAPICTPMFQTEAIPPCRSVCERSRQGCEPLMNEHEIAWPEALNCDRLPEYEKGVCVSQDAIVSEMPEVPDEPEDSVVSTPRVPTRPPPECNCAKAAKPTKNLYKKGNFDYAIAARVNKIKSMDFTNTVTQLTVSKVLKRGRVEIFEDERVDVWTNSSCVCPKLGINKEYLIIGYEDVSMNRLVYLDSSLVSRWNARWEDKVKSWTKVVKGKNKKKRKGRCKKKDGEKPGKKCRRRKRPKKKKSKKDTNKTDNLLTRRRQNHRRRTSKNKSDKSKPTLISNDARRS